MSNGECTNCAHARLSEAQLAELARLKAWYPYRIVYGALHPETGEWRCGAVTTMHAPNKLARAGWSVVRC